MTDYYCPKCERITEIEAITSNAIVSQKVALVQDELMYDNADIEDGNIDHFQCESCGEWIHNKDNHVINDEESLIQFLNNENSQEAIELERYKKICRRLLISMSEIKNLATQGIKARANRSDAKNNPETLRKVITNGTDKIADICFKMLRDYSDKMK